MKLFPLMKIHCLNFDKKEDCIKYLMEYLQLDTDKKRTSKKL